LERFSVEARRTEMKGSVLTHHSFAILLFSCFTKRIAAFKYIQVHPSGKFAVLNLYFELILILRDP
jgi:hypothetical protein